ncbi:hypothetical protein ACFWVP_05875 [Streptomyces sp. NPDC058637]|uniref:hypothetical protein n=1 Tax=Streptomyces sp. NPDC058637 TaxID=3346569 RepID=UPI003666E5F8
MTDWLDAFADRGLIRWNPSAACWERTPPTGRNDHDEPEAAPGMTERIMQESITAVVRGEPRMLPRAYKHTHVVPGPVAVGIFPTE